MNKKAVLSVNAAVLLFGLAGLFAKWIDLPAIGITFGRVLFSSLALGTFLGVRKTSIRLRSKKDHLLMILAGAILAFHWWAFLRSIQISTVAIGTLTFAAFPLFVTFLEPLVFRQRLTIRNIVFAVLIAAGVVIATPAFSIENHMFQGILIGSASSLAYAVLTLLNKRFSKHYAGTVTAFYEQSTAALVLLPIILTMPGTMKPTSLDLVLLLVLGVLMTAVAHTLFISSLKGLSAQLAGICSSMETVYSILFAFLLLKEVPSVREAAGALIIVATVVASQLSERKPD